ncbi:MAG TPA: MCE family protein, partial [Nocardioides sp.]|nr:MCE family protein [Nocardioides sp.]
NLQRAGAAYRAPVASYDPDTGKVRWGAKIDPVLAPTGTLAPQAFGEESWKWLFLQPLVS